MTYETTLRFVLFILLFVCLKVEADDETTSITDDTFYLENIESTAVPIDFTSVIIQSPRHGTIQIRSNHDPHDVGPITADKSVLLKFRIHVAPEDRSRACAPGSMIRLVVDKWFTSYIQKDPCDDDDDSIDWIVPHPWGDSDIFGEHEVELALLDPSGARIATEVSSFLFLRCSNASAICDEEDMGSDGHLPAVRRRHGDVDLVEGVYAGRRVRVVVGSRSSLVRVVVTELFSFDCFYRVRAAATGPHEMLHGRTLRRGAAAREHVDAFRACPPAGPGPTEVRVSVSVAGCASQFGPFEWAAEELTSVDLAIDCAAAAEAAHHEAFLPVRRRPDRAGPAHPESLATGGLDRLGLPDIS